MSSIQSFANKENIQLLWDIISDLPNFRFLPPDTQSQVHNVFLNNIPGFYENEKNKNTSLVDINKKYILLIVTHIKKTHALQPSKITIHNEPASKTLITIEDIHHDRKSRIEQDFARRQEEFEDSMTLKAPSTPEFSDRHTDQPIKEMDKMLKEMHAQRNYEVELINREYNTSNQVDNWLKPQETSLKTEKMNTKMNDNVSRFKHLDQFNEHQPPKKVSFTNDADQVNVFDNDDEDLNIFAKLKKNTIIEDSIISDTNEINSKDFAKLERKVDILHEKINRLIAYLIKD